MEKRLRTLKDDILDLRVAIDICDDEELLDVMYHARSELKILVYDLEDCVVDL